MYDPKVGQFVSEDMIGLNGRDTNLYRYVGNSPTNATDPTGMLSQAQRTAMRDALERAIANLPAETRRRARNELEQIIAAADGTASKMGRRRDDCGNWMSDVLTKIGLTTVIGVKGVGWDCPVGVWGTDWWAGHNAVRVTLPDGTVFYLDDGWWGGYFSPSDIPSYMTPVPDVPDHRLQDIFLEMFRHPIIA